jgi:hypothetical protein
MAEADKDIDFSKYLFITVAAPLGKTLTLSGAFGLSPQTTEKFDGVRYNFASFSPLDSVLPISQYNKNWNWTHDIAHMLGLMHPFEREDRIAWDIMYNFAPQPDFMGWNKWKLNWIADDQGRYQVRRQRVSDVSIGPRRIQLEPSTAPLPLRNL